jgi:hypothetical protein
MVYNDLMTIDDFTKKIIQYDKIEVEEFYADEFQNGEEVFVVRVKLFEDECYRCPICGEKGEKHGYKKDPIFLNLNKKIQNIEA